MRLRQLAVTLLLTLLTFASTTKPTYAQTVNLDDAASAAARLPRLQSFLVSWRGTLVLEKYYKGTQPARLANIKSASKSVISALVGIAIEKGLIKSVREPISTYFPDWKTAERNLLKTKITVEDLLTMRSGLESTSNRNYGAWVQSSNWVRYALARPLVNPPGTTMQYSTGNTHLLSAILTKATGKNTWQFAQEVFAKPQGFILARWPQDPQGIYFGGNDMLMTPRQMVAFGELYMNGGRSKGIQVVPAEWVRASLQPRVASPREFGRFYGYGWWLREMGDYQAYYAWGYGGQFIFLIPDLNLVVVTTSATTAGNDRRDHLRTIFDVVERYVVPRIDRNSQSH